MANVAVGELYRCVLYTRADDQLGLMVRHFRIAGINAGVPTELGICNQQELLLAGLVKPLMAGTAEWRGLTIQKISPLPSRVEVFSNAALGGGTAGAVLMPRQVSGLVKLGSENAGRANRGRLYIPFPATTDDTVDGHPSAGYQVNAAALADALIGSKLAGPVGNTANIIWVVRHAPAFTTTDLTTRVVRERWATQKRRGDFGRPNPL